VTAIAGPSGSGKSSLLRLMGALERPTAGTISFGGDDIARMPTRVRRALRRGRIGFVPSHASAALARGITVGEELRLAAVLRGAGRGWRQGAEQRLERLGLGDRWGARTEHLSSGEQQRVALVAALVGEPDVLLADEVTAALDAVSAGLLLDDLHATAAAGAVVVVATHDPVVIASADELVRLRSGRVAP
jgi:putative ABC transport system ATP-binding protein